MSDKLEVTKAIPAVGGTTVAYAADNVHHVIAALTWSDIAAIVTTVFVLLQIGDFLYKKIKYGAKH